MKTTNEELLEACGKALSQRVMECIRKGKEISKLNARLCLLQAEIVRLQRDMAVEDHPELDPAKFTGVKNYTCRYEDSE